MASFIQLCQDVARESGTISGTLPTTTIGQTGRLLKVVAWTNMAWRNIQNSRGAWRWMQDRFTGQLLPGVQTYTNVAVGIPARFAEWDIVNEYEDRWTTYKTASGVADEGQLSYMPWDLFYRSQLRGTTAAYQGRPTYFSVTPQNELIFSPTPNELYSLRGLFRRDIQTLEAPGDVPEMPARFHDLITWEALKLLGTSDEAAAQFPVWVNNARIIKSDLERDQLPKVHIAGGYVY